jgi:APA family basic amino acid/polyamine antiporter
VMFVYILINISLFHIVPVADIVTLNEKAAAVAAETLFGSWAGKALSLGIIISILGAVNGNILTMPLVPFAMAQKGMFPFAKTVGAINAKTNTPVNSIVLKSSISALMIIYLNPDRITDIAMFIMYTCYAAVFLGIFVLRKKYGVPEKGSYKTPLFPLIPIAASGGSLYVCYSMLVQQPLDGLIALLIALSGLPIYFWLTKKP